MRFSSLTEFREAWLALRIADPAEAAVAGGRLADRLGYAFAAGYRAALHRLVPGLRPTVMACLCVTEEGGAHPRAIRTSLSPEGELTGRKQWATLAGDGDVLLVAASAGTEGDRNLVRLARVDPRAPGVTITAMPPTPFTPEIPHFSLAFDRVRVAEVLPGDGYDRYVKPFRTVEDVHVCLAAAAWMGADGIVDGLRAIAAEPPDDPRTHLRLGDALAELRTFAAAFSPADPEDAARWRRDAPLLQIADRARAARLAAARKRLGLDTPPAQP